MNNNFKIELAQTNEHATSIANLARIIWTEHYTPMIGKDQVEYMLTNFQSAEEIYKQISDEGYLYYMAFVEEQLVGYMALKPDDKSKKMFLSKIYVEKQNRRNGISSMFLNIAIELSRKYDYSTIWLTVNKNNLSSIAAYECLGFKKTEEMVSDIGGGFVMDDYKMELSI